MMTITDLHREDELSAASMGAIVGGLALGSGSFGTGIVVASPYHTTGTVGGGVGGAVDGDVFNFFRHVPGVGLPA
jgi:hypothetical protein